MPALLGFDSASHLLWLEDLGDGGDLTHLYRIGALPNEDCLQLMRYLADLHQVHVPEEASGLLRNRARRALNHEHQYCFALQPDNGLDLDRMTPGLSSRAGLLSADEAYRKRIVDLSACFSPTWN
jgi:5-methylthioribose kinase